MKKVDYEHFSRFLMPHSLKTRGEDIYFCVRHADMEENRYLSDLYRYRDGKTARLTSMGDVNSFSLTDDGIIFAAKRSKAEQETASSGVPRTVFYRLPYDGGEAIPFVTLGHKTGELIPAGNDRYFFIASENLVLSELIESVGDAKKAAGEYKKDGDYHVIDELPFYSNGSGFTNKIHSRLYILENGQCRPLTEKTENCRILSSTDSALCLNISDMSGGCRPEGNRLVLMDKATLQMRDITLGEGCNHRAAWVLDDGRVLALVAVPKGNTTSTNPHVFILENDTWRKVRDDGLCSFGNSVGSDVKAGGKADGFDMPVRGGLFYTLDTVWNHAAVTALDIETGEIKRITDNGMNITAFDFWNDGFAAIAMDGNGGSELYRIDMQGNCERLTEFNTALCNEYEYSEPQRFTFTDDAGTEIEGWVMLPADYDSEKSYPAILDIHGGPKTVYGSCYFHEMQLWTSRGFFVFFCNPTGGDGRGEEFADIFGKYGQQDYRDIMEFTDEVLKRYPAIDKSRVGVTGGSYGGFMTNWIIGHTDRFACAASQRSISNWISFYGTSDIGYTFGKRNVKATPWDGQEAMWEQSPLKYADKCVTPTLFIHSDEDYRCPLSEGLQMFSALREHGVEARMCIFKGENHELSRSGKPEHRVRRLKEITEWMEKYLKP